MKIEQLNVALNDVVTLKMKKKIKERMIRAIENDPELNNLFESMTTEKRKAASHWAEGLKNAVTALVTFYRG